MKVDYIALSIPIFFLLIGIELAYTYFHKLKYYRLNDSISNLSQGIGQQVTGIFMKTAVFFGYKYIYEHLRFFDLPSTVLVWILLFIGVDFFYYWFHRMSHQVNGLWASHIVHHQSEEYNLSVALRQSWFQGWFSWVFYLPLAFFGFDPIMFLTISSFNTLYQFWIHTRAIKSMGFLEYIINTPSHHRVHHGSNPKYIDKNHAGTLIIWDRMFGTFQKEEEAVYYGITKPLDSWNPVWANFHYWIDLFRMSSKAKGFKDKIGVYVHAPGWQPEYLGGYQSAPEIDKENYKKYDAWSGNNWAAYSLLQFVVALVAGSAMLFLFEKMTAAQNVLSAIFIMATLISCGALFERNVWLRHFEIIRLVSSLSLIFVFLNIPNFILISILFILIQIISLIWFFRIQNQKHVETQLI